MKKINAGAAMSIGAGLGAAFGAILGGVISLIHKDKSNEK